MTSPLTSRIMSVTSSGRSSIRSTISSTSGWLAAIERARQSPARASPRGPLGPHSSDRPPSSTAERKARAAAERELDAAGERSTLSSEEEIDKISNIKEVKEYLKRLAKVDVQHHPNFFSHQLERNTCYCLTLCIE